MYSWIRFQGNTNIFLLFPFLVISTVRVHEDEPFMIEFKTIPKVPAEVISIREPED